MKSSRSNCSFTVEFSLIREAILVQNARITQLYTIQSEEDPFLWFGVLFVDSGIYMGAVIRFTMLIQDTYPDCPCPRIILDPIPYHPLVNPFTGELDTKNAFPDWDSKVNKIHELLLFLKRVICNADLYISQIQELINQYETTNPDPNNKIEHRQPSQTDSTEKNGDLRNSMSGDLYYDRNLVSLFNNFEHTLDFIRTYENDHDKLQRLIDTFKHKCSETLYDKPILFGEDRNSLLFTEWNHDIHEPVRGCILAGKFAPVSLFASYHKETDSVSFVPGAEPPNR